MKKESVRRQEARDLMKKRTAQAAATIGIAGGGTMAFAAGPMMADDGSSPEEEAIETTDVKVESQTPKPQRPATQAPEAAQPAAQSEESSTTVIQEAQASAPMAAVQSQINAEPESTPTDVEDSEPEYMPEAIDIDYEDEVVIDEEVAFTSGNAVSGAYPVATVENEDICYVDTNSQEVSATPDIAICESEGTVYESDIQDSITSPYCDSTYPDADIDLTVDL